MQHRQWAEISLQRFMLAATAWAKLFFLFAERLVISCRDGMKTSSTTVLMEDSISLVVAFFVPSQYAYRCSCYDWIIRGVFQCLNFQILEEGGSQIAQEESEFMSKTVVVYNYFPETCDVLWIIIGHLSTDSRRRVGERVDWMVYHSDCKHLHQRSLPVMRQSASLIDRDSDVVGTVVPVHTSGKQDRKFTVTIW